MSDMDIGNVLGHMRGEIPTTRTRAKEHEPIGTSLGALCDEKNAAYGDSFKRTGEIMRILYPTGIQPSQFDDALAVTRVMDKLFRIATRKDAFGENPWADIAGYAILSVARDDKNARSTDGRDGDLGGPRHE